MAQYQLTPEVFIAKYRTQRTLLCTEGDEVGAPSGKARAVGGRVGGLAGDHP